MQTKSLDIGCDSKPKNIFNANPLYGIDVRDDLKLNDVNADLVTDSIPFENNTFKYFAAHDFLEHLPRLMYAALRRNSFIGLMSEVCRVFQQNGKSYPSTPALPQATAFWDPTHVNFITEDTFPLYFDNKDSGARGYEFKGSFEIESQTWQDPHLISTLIKK